MKKFIILVLLLSLCAPATIEAKPTKKMGRSIYLPFAPKGKYGKLPTKKAKRNNRAESWRFKQWGR